MINRHSLSAASDPYNTVHSRPSDPLSPPPPPSPLPSPSSASSCFGSGAATASPPEGSGNGIGRNGRPAIVVGRGRGRGKRRSPKPRMEVARKIVQMIPNPFAAFVPSKSVPSLHERERVGRRLAGDASGNSSAVGAAPGEGFRTIRSRGLKGDVEDVKVPPLERIVVPLNGGVADPEGMDGTKVDVLAWFARATLDVIGEAGESSRLVQAILGI